MGFGSSRNDDEVGEFRLSWFIAWCRTVFRDEEVEKRGVGGEVMEEGGRMWAAQGRM